MVRLIVDDAGHRRAFNVGEGRLSVGSGSEARLRLESPGVAPVHADIEVHGGKAILHPKPGVTAPQVLGRPASGPIVLQHGESVQIGGATLTVEYEAPSTRPRSSAEFPAALASAPGAKRRPEPTQDARDAARRARRQGLPIWAWIAAGIPVLGGAGWYFMGGALGDKARQFRQASAGPYYKSALDRFHNAQYPQALEDLAHIPADARLDPALAAQVDQLRADIAAKLAESKDSNRNATLGQQYFDSQLKGFVERYMSGEIASPQARVFLKRARYFRAKWPTHPGLEWVARQEARFKGAVDLGAPPSFEDVRFEVESLTWSFPCDYREAFAVARAFQAGASGGDLQKAADFLAELELERKAWFEERMQQARSDFEHDRTGESLGVLVSIIRYAGDEGMADQAANQWMRFGDMQTWLRDFRANDPEGFEELAKNRVIAAFVKENKL